MRQLQKINLCNGAIKIKFTNDTYLVMAETGDVARYSFFTSKLNCFRSDDYFYICILLGR
jgi:hypothetical protein